MRPRLVRRARLRGDAVRGGFLLLWPERGLRLDAIGAAIVRLCDGTRTVDEIVDALAATYEGSRARIDDDVRAFLGRLAARGLLDRARIGERP